VSEEVERLLREFLDNTNLSERVSKLEARLEERARIEDREHGHDFRTQSGSWDLEAILAVQRAKESKKKSTIPPGLRAISTMMDSAGGKVGALIGAAFVTWLIEHLPAILHALR
jgi:hypothetical protein